MRRDLVASIETAGDDAQDARARAFGAFHAKPGPSWSARANQKAALHSCRPRFVDRAVRTVHPRAQMVDQKRLVLVVDNSRPAPGRGAPDAADRPAFCSPPPQAFGPFQSHRPRGRERINSVAREHAAQMRSLADQVERLSSTGSSASYYSQLIEELVRVSCGILEAAVCLSAMVDDAQESGILPRGPDDGAPLRP